jgi:Holliday junction resolvasome RuvABC endonuclease subunit
MGLIIVGIDPGVEKSGVAVWNGERVLVTGIPYNRALLEDIKSGLLAPAGALFAIEGVQSYGKVVGASIFKTCYLIGRILEAIGCPVGEDERHIVYRKDIKLFLTGTIKSKDKDVRHALIQRLGKEATKDCTGHIWSALAVAVYFYSNMAEKENLKKREIN